ncbi:hypothetical protein BBP40_001514 [Aspergillus hancockii]|nr:hypothetical protein BBP40_001514 [Aspergillus hancockii]
MTRFEKGCWNPGVVVTTWFLKGVTTIAVTSRLVTKWLVFGKLINDDHLIIASLAFCVGNTLAISVAIANGFGDRTDAATRNTQDTEMKSQLAAILLFVLSLLCSRLSMIVFIRDLTPAHRDRVLEHIAQGFMIVFAVIAIFGSAFQCQFPKTWDYLRETCIDAVTWTTFIGPTSAVTDIMIFFQVMLLMGYVQTTWKKKVISECTHFFNVVAPYIAQIVLFRIYNASVDPFVNTSPATICMEITQSLSIITACWGQLKPFLTRLRSNASPLQNTDWSSTTYNKRSRPPQLYSRARATFRQSGREFVPPSTNGTETTVSALNASAE